GSARLDQVRLRPFFAHDLADLLTLQLANEPRCQEEAQQHGRDRGHDDAKRNVTQDVQSPGPAKLRTQREEQLVNHGRAAFLDMRSAITCSVRIPREPFTSTTSCGPSRERTRAATPVVSLV